MHPVQAILLWTLALFGFVTAAPHPQYDTNENSTSCSSVPNAYTTPSSCSDSYLTTSSYCPDTYMTSSCSYDVCYTASSYSVVYETTSSSCYNADMSSSYSSPPDTCTTSTPYYPTTYVTSSSYGPPTDTSCYTCDIYYTSYYPDTSYSTSMVYYPPTTSCYAMSSSTSYYYPDTSTSSYYYPDTESTTESTASSYYYPPDTTSSSYYSHMSCTTATSDYYPPYMTSSSYSETSSSYTPPTYTSPPHNGCLSTINSYLIKAESSYLSGYAEEYSYLIWTPAESDTGFTSYSFCSIGYSIHAPDAHAALFYSGSGCLDQGTASLAEYWKGYPHHAPPPTNEAEWLFVMSATSYPYPVGLDGNIPSEAGYTAFGIDSNGYLTYGGEHSWALCTPSSGNYITDTRYLYWLGGSSCPDHCYPATLKLVPYGFPYPVDHYYKNQGGNCSGPISGYTTTVSSLTTTYTTTTTSYMKK